MIKPRGSADEPSRYLSLDVLRGITIALMVTVNSPGDHEASFAQLKHAAWHGFTLTDLVFPTFLFVVGNALSFTMGNETLQRSSVFLKKVFTRTAILVLIGLFLNSFFLVHVSEDGSLTMDGIAHLRLVCVLERIAFSYCLVSLLLRYCGERMAIAFGAVALLAYWWIMYFFGNHPDPYLITTNAATKLDLFLLGDAHIWHGEGVPFDPEGLLGTLPSEVNVLCGYFTGKYIRSNGPNGTVISRLILVGIALVVLAMLWDLWFPINKKLWTSSFVLITVGWDLVGLALLVLIIDKLQMTRWTKFFVVFGRNPIALYVLSYVTIMLLYIVHIRGSSVKEVFYDSLFVSWLPSKIASLAFALTITLFIWLVGYYMNRKKIFIKI